MFTPALSILRENFPKSQIDLLVTYGPQVAEVLKEKQTVDRIFKIAWPKASLFEKLKVIGNLRKEKYDLAIVTSETNPWKAGIFSFLIGAKKRVGSSQIPGKKPQHRVDINLAIVRLLGIKVNESPQPFLEFDQKKKNSNKILIGFHPGADKTHQYLLWDKDYFVELGKKIIENYKDAHLMIFGGPGEEDLCQEIKEQIKENVFSAVNLPLKEVMALIDSCQVFVAADSGLGHLAGATKTNLISIFGPSDPKIYAPCGVKVKVLSETCRHPYDEKRIHTCLKKITPNMVLVEIKKILEK